MTSPSSRSSDRPIRVSDHALERARQRHGDLRSMTERTLLRTIVREVGDALRNERVAKTAPRELSTEVYTQRAKSRWCRYAWNASRSRVYVLRRTEGVQLVVTVLSTVHSQA